MPTSELSDALNPNINKSRRYEDYRTQQHDQNNTSYGQQPNEVAVPRPRQINPVHELLRVVVAAKESEQIERQRRLAWEQEQERRFADMQQEILGLKSYISLMSQGNNATTFPDHQNSVVQLPPLPHQTQTFSQESLVPHYPTYVVQESSTMPLGYHSAYEEGPPSTTTASPPSSAGDPGSSHLRKRTSTVSTITDDESSDEEDSTASEGRPLKRVNGHDSRCLTIAHAMKLHIYHCMAIDEDRQLPDNHIEGALLEPNQPVRFIWERTVKQSPHNARMKARVIADLLGNRQLYEHVPEKDFDPAVLDSVFDQSFVTLRRKFRAQRDTTVAAELHEREMMKNIKTRRMTRKRTKLGTRTTSRKNLIQFSHSTFDGALQLDCMSSEESEDERIDSSSRSATTIQIIRIRGLPWRSSRLLRLYSALDEEYQLRATTKRGVGKKERRPGPMKDGYLILPPSGVAEWMVSKRWLKRMSGVHKDLEDWMKPLLVNSDFDWKSFPDLGEESEVEDMHPPIYPTNPLMQNSSSSLQFALRL